MVDDDAESPDEVSSMMEKLWGPRNEPPLQDADPAAPTRRSGRVRKATDPPIADSAVSDGPEQVGERLRERDLDALRSHFDGVRAELADLVAGVLEELAAADGRLAATETRLLSRLEQLEARVEQLETAGDRQAMMSETALARANEASAAVAGIARITKMWTGRRKA